MRHLIIDSLGPLRHVDIFLERLNVIIGPQSSGKSCVLKIASYCTWVIYNDYDALSEEVVNNE